MKKSGKEMVGKSGRIFVDLGHVRGLERGSVPVTCWADKSIFARRIVT